MIWAKFVVELDDAPDSLGGLRRLTLLMKAAHGAAGGTMPSFAETAMALASTLGPSESIRRRVLAATVT
jgi:hypothetical protein